MYPDMINNKNYLFSKKDKVPGASRILIILGSIATDRK